MKILIACIPTPANTYMYDLIKGLNTFADVTWDYKEFWEMENHYDIIHIHWPEFLSFEIESYTHNTTKLPVELCNSIIDCLEFWYKKSTIVYTRHVRAPHKRDDEEFKLLYKTVFGYCTGITHFANFSTNQFKSYFPELNIPIHQIIPQHKHISLPDTSNKEMARRKLKIDKEAKVLLCFGVIKENEKELINTAYKAIPGNNKVLLAPAWNTQRRKIGYIRLREWVFNFEKWMHTFNKKRRIDLGFIPYEDAHYYCNAADVLLIPRTNELFSGNISLGFTFGLVVLGKNDSNIGEILELYDNPTFKVDDLESLSDDTKKAFILTNSGLGDKNRQIANTIWSLEAITDAYKEFYEEAISKSENQLI
jgi:glycosyltransferase involved in cell wall biosynthesis